MAQSKVCSQGDLTFASMADAVTSALGARTQSGERLDGFVALAAGLGFDGFSYLVLTHDVTPPQLLGHWTTAGRGWTSRYAARGYHFVDPRVTKTWGRSVPIVWDGAPDGLDMRSQAFLADAGRRSIRGGVAMSLHDVHGRSIVIAWDSSSRIRGSSHEEEIRGRLGTVALLAGFVHEAMIARCREDSRDHRPSDLTERERECIALAARGMTSADIGLKLGISERTANFHFGNVVTKLRALNRGEAIARAVAMNLVSIAR